VAQQKSSVAESQEFRDAFGARNSPSKFNEKTQLASPGDPSLDTNTNGFASESEEVVGDLVASPPMDGVHLRAETMEAASTENRNIPTGKLGIADLQTCAFV